MSCFIQLWYYCCASNVKHGLLLIHKQCNQKGCGWWCWQVKHRLISGTKWQLPCTTSAAAVGSRPCTVHVTSMCISPVMGWSVVLVWNIHTQFWCHDQRIHRSTRSGHILVTLKQKSLVWRLILLQVLSFIPPSHYVHIKKYLSPPKSLWQHR